MVLPFIEYSKFEPVAVIVILPSLGIGQVLAVGLFELTLEMAGPQSESAQSVIPSPSSSILLLQFSRQFEVEVVIVVALEKASEQPLPLLITALYC